MPLNEIPLNKIESYESFCSVIHNFFLSKVSLMEASPSFSFIDPRESSLTESGETLAGLHGDSGKTDSGKEDAKGKHTMIVHFIISYTHFIN